MKPRYWAATGLCPSALTRKACNECAAQPKFLVLRDQRAEEVVEHERESGAAHSALVRMESSHPVPLRMCPARQMARRILRSHRIGAAQVDVDDLVLSARGVPVQQDPDTARWATRLIHLGRAQQWHVGPAQITGGPRREGGPQIGR